MLCVEMSLLPIALCKVAQLHNDIPCLDDKLEVSMGSQRSEFKFKSLTYIEELVQSSFGFS